MCVAVLKRVKYGMLEKFSLAAKINFKKINKKAGQNASIASNQSSRHPWMIRSRKNRQSSPEKRVKRDSPIWEISKANPEVRHRRVTCITSSWVEGVAIPTKAKEGGAEINKPAVGGGAPDPFTRLWCCGGAVHHQGGRYFGSCPVLEPYRKPLQDPLCALFVKKTIAIAGIGQQTNWFFPVLRMTWWKMGPNR